MADEEKTLNSAETESPVEEPKKAKKEKAPKESKADKQAAKNAKKEKAQMQKDWENSIIATKRVKREETRRKLKRAMLFMLVVALIITSVVYIMLLFIDENNVRITASSQKGKGKTISLSMDNEVWSPYLNGKGPRSMSDVSYNKRDYNESDQLGVQVSDVRQVLLNNETFEPGVKSESDYISFAFMLRNDSAEDAILVTDMSLEYDKVRNLQNCVRVMWGTSTKNHPEFTDVKIYAALSENSRLAGTSINRARKVDEKYLEYVAYPVGTDDPKVDMYEFEKEMRDDGTYNEEVLNGYFATTPFFSDEYVFNYESTLEGGDILYCYVVIWLEGSDFDCVDSALGGYVKLSINFTAM